MSRSFASSTLVAFLLIACGGSTAATGNNGATGQKLLTKEDGSPTITGSRCSWQGTVVAAGVVTKEPPPTHAIGDSFVSLDGCNQCSCTAQGITCTTNACGSSSGSTSGQVHGGCTTEAKVCPDGTSVGRTGPSCAFAPCPGGDADGGAHACSDIAKLCPDGSYASPSGPSCEIVCPSVSCNQLGDAARKEVDSALSAHASCNSAEDCQTIDYSTKCFDSCTRAINKAGLADLAAAKDRANASTCVQFASQGCKVEYPPCSAPQPPQCSGHICQ